MLTVVSMFPSRRASWAVIGQAWCVQVMWDLYHQPSPRTLLCVGCVHVVCYWPMACYLMAIGSGVYRYVAVFAAPITLWCDAGRGVLVRCLLLCSSDIWHFLSHSYQIPKVVVITIQRVVVRWIQMNGPHSIYIECLRHPFSGVPWWYKKTHLWSD